ncbi:deoxyribodipyrimidine photo-lyase (single-stranded DNA-specific) [Spirosomataceae bacterium TFI 002]|nr:deoxyribodipyrimidine photo-lyase (single-stranded DNA-specific) [Spirosomataceae bacterium TFI 002]
MGNVLFWFRNDLRLHDNEALIKAAETGAVIPVFVLDKKSFKKTSLGFKRTGAFRTQFLLDSLSDLKTSLRSIGSDLIIKIGDPETEVIKLAKAYEVTHIFTSKEVTQEETNLEYEISQQLKPLNIEMGLVWGATLYHVLDLPFQVKFLPDIFTEFKNKLEQHSRVRPIFPTVTSLNSPKGFSGSEVPTLSKLGFGEEKIETVYKGGESAGLARVKEYIWQKELVKTYKETRNGLLGKDYSSKFSPWISLGCISPRFVFEEIQKFEEKVIKNDSTYWLIYELMWRDYFHFVSLKYGIRLFKRSGIKHVMNLKWRNSKPDFQKWCDGNTGVPFVDANMRELKETGFMSNRGRQIVASFLTKDLKIEWWWGAMYFESKLLDYDVCSNWGNWNYVAGIGNDPRVNRYFNILKQAANYDPDGEYVRNWIPELSTLPVAELNTPWLSEQATVLKYPKPILDVTAWK